MRERDRRAQSTRTRARGGEDKGQAPTRAARRPDPPPPLGAAPPQPARGRHWQRGRGQVNARGRSRRRQLGQRARLGAAARAQAQTRGGDGQDELHRRGPAHRLRPRGPRRQLAAPCRRARPRRWRRRWHGRRLSLRPAARRRGDRSRGHAGWRDARGELARGGLPLLQGCLLHRPRRAREVSQDHNVRHDGSRPRLRDGGGGRQPWGDAYDEGAPRRGDCAARARTHRRDQGGPRPGEHFEGDDAAAPPPAARTGGEEAAVPSARHG
mmetsp:Transcript_44389/g.109958  ORF Transcript_44389/g.109958 Transcript_44389/m.109958 type:complete len:268 (-) Transcript_44389:869-1672(-)